MYNGGGNLNHDEEKQDYESKVKEKLGIKNDKEPSFEEKIQSTMGIKAIDGGNQ